MSRRKGRRKRREAARESKRRERSDAVGGLDGAFSYHKAYRHGKACALNTGWKKSVQEHELHLFSRTARTCSNVKSGRNKWKKCTHFTVCERGKVRPIDAPHVIDRHTQKIITKEILLPLYEPSMIYNNGASLPDKGLALARRLLKEDLSDHFRRYGLSGWVIVADCEKFFPNAPHETILANHAKFIYDAPTRALCDSVLEAVPSERGVPLGVEPSQIEMVALPSPVDNYMKCQVGLKGYGHYMDDYVMCVPPERDPKQILDTFIDRMGMIGVKINRRKTHIIRFGRPFRFCKAKYSVSETGRITVNGSRDSAKRTRHKAKFFHKLIEDSEMDYLDLWSAVQGTFNYYNEFDDHGRVLKLRQQFYSLYGFGSEDRENFKRRTTMTYMVTKRFRETVQSGPVNLPYGTICEAKNGRICHDGKFLVRERSRLAHTNFSANDDGMAAERGELTRKIEAATVGADAATMKRIKESKLCQKYRKQEHQDVWLWAHEFFIAPIPILRTIAETIELKK